MQFKSQQIRLFWQSMAIAVLAEMAIVAIAADLLKGDSTFLETAVMLLLGLWAATIIILLKNILVGLVVRYFTTEAAVQGLLGSIRAAKLPPPEEFESSAEDYFNRIAGDANELGDKRAAAGTFSGILAYPAAHGRVTESLVLKSRFEKALALYRAEFPPTP